MSRMQRNALILFCSLSSTCVLAGEAADPKAKVVPTASHFLNLVFSEPMLTWMGSSALDGITITPPFRCKWLWNDDFNLVCLGEGNERLQPATQYKISIRGGLWTQQDQEIGEQDLLFETQRPSIHGWGAVIDHWEGRSPLINIMVNVPVSAAALSAALVLSEDGNDVPYKLIPQTESRWIPIAHENRSWRIDFQPTDSAAHTLSLRLKPGLRSSKGPLLGEQDELLLRARINEQFGLRFAGCGRDLQTDRSSSFSAIPQFRAHIVNVTTDSNEAIAIECPAGQPISLGFSQPLSSEAIAWLKSHLPPGLRYEKAAKGPLYQYSDSGRLLGRPSSIASLVSDTPNSQFTFEIPASFVSAEGARIVRSNRINVRSTGFISELALKPEQLLLLPGSKPPPIISMTNMPAIDVDIKEIGGGELETRRVTVAEESREAVHRQPPPSPLPEISKHGGYVDGTLNLPQEFYYSPAHYSMAYAAFNVTTGRAGDQALVWVTNWKGATPVANAKVELLPLSGSNSSSVVATARTGKDGVALFDLSGEDNTGARKFSLVRVTRRGQRTVLPATGLLGGNWASRNEKSAQVLPEGKKTSWGVTDHLLYHPGDTVKYRLWVRERRQNRLRPMAGNGAIKVGLTGLGYASTPITEFSLQLDQFGSAADELTLPTTMPEDDYCIFIGGAHFSGVQGPCFRVTDQQASDLWAELNADRSSVLDGEPVTLDVEAGYLSGGSAVGAKAEFLSLLTPRRLEQAYPDFSTFTFIDPYESTAGDAGESLQNTLNGAQFIGADGHSKRTFTLEIPSVPGPFGEGGRQPIPFGVLDLTASISTSTSGLSTAPIGLRFSRYPRFVGLKVAPLMLRTDKDPEIEAVLITDSGELVHDATIDVDIEERVDDGMPGTRFSVVGHCTVPVGRPTQCPFRPKHSGDYRFRAHSPGAASTTVQRYASVDGKWASKDIDSKVSLTITDKHPAIGTTTELLLQQPFAQARVLFSVEHVRVLKYWVQHVDSPLTRISVPVDPDWIPGVTINAVVVNAQGEAFGAHAVKGELVKTDSLNIYPRGEPGPAPVTISLDRTEVRPADRIQIRLRNPRSESTQVTLGVVDDVYRALAPKFIDAANPEGSAWLGKIDSWQVPVWYGYGNWERQLDGKSGSRPLAPRPVFDFGDSERLDTHTLMGPELGAVDFFRMGRAAGTLPGRPAFGVSNGSAVRRQLLPTAFWQTEIVMPPGSDRTIDIRLPDYPTRWRVLAWAADETDGFSLSEATISASPPIEARNDAPPRLLVGDQATIQTSIAAIGDDATVNVSLQAKGAGIDVTENWSGTVLSNRQQSISLLARPTEAGQISVVAQVSGSPGQDGATSEIDVASSWKRETMQMFGWLPAEGVRLQLPPLPDGAVRSGLSVAVGGGTGALVRSWALGLRDHSHASWEQTLSRAVGAAIAIRLGFAVTDWPDAENVIEKALQDASKFQGERGGFHFFVGATDREISPPSLMLTAYSVQSFAFLRSLGYKTPAGIEEKARSALFGRLNQPPTVQEGPTSTYWNEEAAFAAAILGAEAPVPFKTLDAIWEGRDQLTWSGRANLARVLAFRAPYVKRARQLIDQLRLAGTRRGTGRAIQELPAYGWPFQGQLLDQCGVLQALSILDRAKDAREVRDEYIRGFSDLYAGAMPTQDTQALSQCLMALSDAMPEPSHGDVPVMVDVSAADFSTRLELLPGQSTASLSTDVAILPRHLNLSASPVDSTLLSVMAKVEYDIDERKPEPAAVGFSLKRQYSVVRDHVWKNVSAESIREGDWVRVTLRLSNSRVRYFVALSDTLPGGLRATDLALSAQVDQDLLDLSAENTSLFPARNIGEGRAHFYSERLPPGTHEVHYYARATHAGRFAALPAMAELMYGNATVSRTTPVEFEVEAATSPVKP